MWNESILRIQQSEKPVCLRLWKKALIHSLATANIKTTLLHHPQTYSDKKLWVDCVRRVWRMIGSWGLLSKCHSVQRRRLIPNCAWMCVNGSFCQRYCVRWSLTILCSVLLCEWVKLCWRIQTNFQRCSKKKNIPFTTLKKNPIILAVSDFCEWKCVFKLLPISHLSQDLFWGFF